MFGWNLFEILSFGATAGFLIFLALATKPGATLLEGKGLSAKTIKYTHFIVLAGLILGFLCVVGSVMFYIIEGE